ncbi:SDR family NAD(P)-dependent oxidoreductase [Curtobacterium sp. MCJR17_043]|uniref:SDR family NAD(P)-dependent oxidoreductase n=1 Tax=Curtobacterium sp. MCJR17_043 TaxID=2175660 RepID=UPI0032E87839
MVSAENRAPPDAAGECDDPPRWPKPPSTSKPGPDVDLGIQGKTALVFGGDSGIGWNTARILLAEGATVVVTDIDQSRLDTSADQLEAPHGKLHAFAADVRSADSLAALHAKVRDAVGEIDILVQSSGVTGAQGMFHEIDEAGWQETLDIDLMGPVRITREFISDLRNGGWGRIVYLVSEDARQPYDDELPYCAAKAGGALVREGPLALLRARGAAREHGLPPRSSTPR